MTAEPPGGTEGSVMNIRASPLSASLELAALKMSGFESRLPLRRSLAAGSLLRPEVCD